MTCFYGVIVSGVLGAGRRAARQAPTVACFYAIVFNGALGAERRTVKLASTVAFFYGIMWRRWREQTRKRPVRTYVRCKYRK